MVLSLQSSHRYNEFAQQLAVPFSKRLTAMHHPVQRLTEQFRFRHCFLNWLNHRTYDGEMTSHPSTDNIIVKPQFLKAMQNTPNMGHPGNLNLGHIVEAGTNSRFNDQNRLWVLKLLLENFRSAGNNGDDIAIITPYMAQVIRYKQSPIVLMQKGALLRSNFHKVATTDSMQGKEAKVVIYGWVITSAGDMGFTTDDHRGNVGMSRTSEVMINILHSSIGSDAKSSSRAPHQNYLGGQTNTEVPYPCAFIQWHSSQENIVTVDCPHEDDVFPVVHQQPEGFAR
ncbi:hypothetical protein N8T08_004889 [Aspergillus melleus]|uniref:Uncharacterized protein n=1 Tax=Aspergillus melleus TaxID=138277 RepID=A0ACC3B394_9EURO|nr:hypothetical protein N8T08_004889 [Aspergillus melleus]